MRISIALAVPPKEKPPSGVVDSAHATAWSLDTFPLLLTPGLVVP